MKMEMKMGTFVHNVHRGLKTLFTEFYARCARTSRYLYLSSNLSSGPALGFCIIRLCQPRHPSSSRVRITISNLSLAPEPISTESRVTLRSASKVISEDPPGPCVVIVGRIGSGVFDQRPIIWRPIEKTGSSDTVRNVIQARTWFAGRRSMMYFI